MPRQTVRRPTAADLGPLVACVDGPMAGQWFTLADWEAGVEASRRMVELAQRPSPRLAYDWTGDEVTGPGFRVARALAYRPGR